MKLRHLRVENFRGIRTLDWFLSGDFICLLGPGDSGKSTILDAVELVLSPRWNPSFDDSDFFGLDTQAAIKIEATIGALPRSLRSDGKFGLRLRGLTVEGSIRDEPDDADEEVITIRLTVDSSLEPVWHVVTDRHPAGDPISARDRERLGMVRLGSVFDWHLSWRKGSALARVTGDLDEHAQLLADAGRMARSTIASERLPKLGSAAEQTRALAAAFGVRHRDVLTPRLDAASASFGSGGLTLHDGVVPARRAGLGTRRLVTLALQRHVARDGGIVLIDEVEQGLEPYRLRRLLSELLRPSVPKASDGKEPNQPEYRGVCLMTTHAPTAITQLNVDHLRIVHESNGRVEVVRPSLELQRFVRRNPEAFLSRRVLVCEGDTEQGLVYGLDLEWSKHRAPMAVSGVALADGGGCSAVGAVAQAFQSLGYQTAVLADSDRPLDVDPTVLEGKGILTLLWTGSVSTEQRIFMDLPAAGVVEAIELAVALHSFERIQSQLATQLQSSTNDIPQDPTEWLQKWQDARLRAALGAAAKSGSGWYKRFDHATELGRIVARQCSLDAPGDLADKLRLLINWIDG